MNPVDSDLLPAGNLKHVARVARAIDHGLQELETVLGSVLNLMPCDENKPQALEAMRSVEQEVKDMEEATGNMLVELQNILSAGELNLQKARETNKSIEEGMLLIESTLEKYGYDSSKMPAFTQPDPDEEAANASEFEENEESFDDDESSAVECLTSDSPTTLSLQRNEAQTPAYQVSRTRVETMAGAEVTPDVLSSKLMILGESNSPRMVRVSSNNQLKLKSLAGAKVTPDALSPKPMIRGESNSPRMVRVSPNNPFKLQSSSLNSRFLSPLPNEESVPKKSAEWSAPTRPVRPVLSTVSFD